MKNLDFLKMTFPRRRERETSVAIASLSPLVSFILHFVSAASEEPNPLLSPSDVSVAISTRLRRLRFFGRKWAWIEGWAYRGNEGEIQKEILQS